MSKTMSKTSKTRQDAVAAAQSLSLSRDRAVVLVVDIQDRLAAAMPTGVEGQVERNACVLIEAARLMKLPVVVAQQYPARLGQTVSTVATAVNEAEADAAGRVHRVDKLEFSVCENPAFGAVWDELGRDQWIVIGMEAHVCVYQSARDLLARGAAVHVPSDAVVSRTEHNWQTGLDLIGRAGGVVTSTEVVVFDLLGRAGTDEFKAMSRLVK